MRAAATSVRDRGDPARGSHDPDVPASLPDPASATAATTTATISAAAVAMRMRSAGGGGLLERLLGVVARAHERAGGDRLEAHRVRLALQVGELVRVPVAHDRQVVLRGTQVLADGEYLDAVLAQDAEGLEQLFLRLAQAGHQAGLGDDLVAAHLLGVLEHPAGAQERRPAPCQRVQARDGLHVVVEDVGALGDHAGERHLLTAEVRRQHLDLAARRQLADRADHTDERGRAQVREVVAVDAGDDRVAQLHLLDLLRDAKRLERVVVRRLAGLDVAEAAAPRARVTQDHESRGARLPALADVRAGRLLADRVQRGAVDLRLQLQVLGRSRRLDLEPRRLALAVGPHVVAHDLQDLGASGVGSRPRAHATPEAIGAGARSRSSDTIRWRSP